MVNLLVERRGGVIARTVLVIHSAREFTGTVLRGSGRGSPVSDAESQEGLLMSEKGQSSGWSELMIEEPMSAGPSLDTRALDRARMSRDPRFDGKFFIAVTSTRIYCRPICKVR